VHSWVEPRRRARVLEQLERLETSGVAERHPLLDRARLQREFYPRADAFVMPSHAEGFGFTNVEALSFGLPVVSSRVGAIPEVVLEEVTGLLVAADDITGLAARMERLAVDPAAAARMGAAGREDFLARFTLDRFRSELGRVYQEALVSCAGR